MKYLIYIVVFFFLISCKKDATIKVKTINKVTGAPMPGVTIYVSEALSWDPVNTAQGAFYYGETDQNGEHIINIEMRNNGKYKITQSSAQNSCWHSDKSLSLEKTKNQNVTFEFAPCAQLKFSYENIDCQGSDDYFEVNRYTNLEGYLGFNINAVYEGCANYTMPSFVDVPMGWWFFEWTVIKNGVEENFSDSVYLEEGEELLYEFQY